MSDCGPVKEIYAFPNSMFQCGSNFMKLFLLKQNKEVHKSKHSPNTLVKISYEAVANQGKFFSRPEMLSDCSVSF